MESMASLKAHFDGRSIVLDEPATLAVGQAVRVLIEGSADQVLWTQSASGKSGSVFSPLVEMTAALMSGDEWDESVALHIDALDAVPADFVRRPGSAAGQIKMVDDFDATPDGFEDYL